MSRWPFALPVLDKATDHVLYARALLRRIRQQSPELTSASWFRELEGAIEGARLKLKEAELGAEGKDAHA